MIRSFNQFLRYVCVHLFRLVRRYGSLAGPFEYAASPSRFELLGKSGARIGHVFRDSSCGQTAYRGSAAYHRLGLFGRRQHQLVSDELQPNSCRPWVTLERKTVNLPANNKRAFLFNWIMPSERCAVNAASCDHRRRRPAYKALIESGGANMSLPVSGRIAIRVHVREWCRNESWFEPNWHGDSRVAFALP